MGVDSQASAIQEGENISGSAREEQGDRIYRTRDDHDLLGNFLLSGEHIYPISQVRRGRIFLHPQVFLSGRDIRRNNPEIFHRAGIVDAEDIRGEEYRADSSVSRAIVFSSGAEAEDPVIASSDRDIHIDIGESGAEVDFSSVHGHLDSIHDDRGRRRAYSAGHIFADGA